MTEAVGQAIGEYSNGILDETEAMIAATAAELREDFSWQIDQLRAELSGQVDLVHTQGAETRAEVEKILARRRRAKSAKPSSWDKGWSGYLAGKNSTQGGDR